MAMSANVRVMAPGLTQQTQAAQQAARSASQVANRLTNPRGIISGGGGRGGFEGGLTDFLSRDEFTGRTGTIARVAGQGNVIGALLAFVSVEEFAAAMARWLKGERGFLESVKEQVKLLTPSLMREHLPEIAKGLGIIEDREKLRAELGREFRTALANAKFVARPGGGYLYIPSTGGDYEGSSATEAQMSRYRNSDEYRRKLEEGIGSGRRK